MNDSEGSRVHTYTQQKSEENCRRLITCSLLNTLILDERFEVQKLVSTSTGRKIWEQTQVSHIYKSESKTETAKILQIILYAIHF